MRGGFRAAFLAAPLLMLLWTPLAALQTHVQCPAPDDTVQSLRISLARETENIAGYHDCQRLLTRDGRSAPIVGIWARDFIDGFTVAEFSRGFMATAVIYNFSAESYPDLGIGPGYNCLYMRRQGVAWHAFVVQLGSTRVCPGDPVPPNFKRTTLSVKVQPNTRGEAPPAVRWDMDPATLTPYMGIGCPDGWCEVGAPGFTPSFAYPGRKEVRVKGWYDEQPLSGEVRGRVIPAANLEKVSDKDLRNWTRVATIILDKDSTGYVTERLGLEAGMSAHIALRVAEGKWEARLEQGERVVARPVVRVEHGEVRVPGTARWVWDAEMVRVWVRCGRGAACVVSLK